MNVLRKTCTLIMFVLALGTRPSIANTSFEKDSFEHQLRKILENGDGHSLAGVVVADGKIQWQGGIGIAVLPHTPATSKTIYQIASVSKIIVGLALCDLIASGKISLDASISELAPDLLIDNPFVDSPILVRHLLEHTTGIQEIFPRWYDERIQPSLSVRNLMHETLSRIPVKWRPGERTVYSNFNYVVASHLIESLTGMSFDDYFAIKFFVPMGLDGANFRHFASSSPNFAHGYIARSSTKLTETLGIYRVAAGMSASAEDLGKLILMIINDGVYEGQQIVAREALDIMESRTSGPAGTFNLDLGHGSGVVAREMRGYRVFGHNGIVDGFMASLFYSRKEKFGYAVMTNTHLLPNAPALSKVRDAIFDHFITKNDSKPKTIETSEDLEGFYQFSSSRFAQLAPFDRLLKNVWITTENGQLVEKTLFKNSRSLVSTGPNKFSYIGTVQSEIVIAKDANNQNFMFKAPNSYYQRTSALYFYLSASILALSAIFAGSIPALCLVLFFGKARKRSQTIGFCSVFLSFCMIAVSAYFLRTSEVALQFNWTTALLFIGTLLFYVSGVLTFIVACIGLSQKRSALNWFSATTATAVNIWSHFLMHCGFIGIKLWDNAHSFKIFQFN